MWWVLGATMAMAGPLDDCEQGIRDTPEVGAPWRCLGNVARQTGEFEAATLLAERLVDAYPDNPHGQKALGLLVSDQGDTERATQLWLSAVDTLEADGELRDVAFTLFNLASIEEDFETSMAYLQRAADATRDKDPYLHAIARLEEATLLNNHDANITLAHRILDEVRPVILAGDMAHAKVRLHQQTSILHEDARRIGASIKARYDLLQLAEEQGNIWLQASTAGWLGQKVYTDPEHTAFIHGGDPVGWLRTQIALAEQADNAYALGDLRRALAVLLYPSDESKALMAASVAMLDAIQTMPKGQQGTLAHAAAIFGDEPDRAQVYVDRCIALGPDSPLCWAAKIRLLGDRGQSDAALAEGDRLWAAFFASLAASEDPFTLRGERLDHRLWVEPYLTHLAQQDPALALQRFDLLERLTVGGPTEAVDLAALQAALGPDEAIAVLREGYFYLPGLIDPSAWLITRDEVAWLPLPGARAQRPTVAVLGTAILEGQDTAAALERLDAGLFQPLIERLDPRIDRIAVMPSGWMQEVPWNLLPSAQGSRSITHIPNLAWTEQHWTDRIAPGPAAALVDPILPTLPQVAGLQRLPRANDEGDWLARTLDAEVLGGAEATRAGALGLNPDTRLLHIGAHAVINGAYPAESAVLLSPDAHHNGMWTSDEIAGSDQTDRVVVLAACRGANTLTVDGEGPKALADAFLAAGAQAVVAQLWPIRDDHALQFNEALYTELSRGVTIGDAVHTARNRMREAGLPAQAWAGTVVLGNPHATPLKPSAARPVPLWLRAGGFALGVAFLMWVFGRAAKRGAPI